MGALKKINIHHFSVFFTNLVLSTLLTFWHLLWQCYFTKYSYSTIYITPNQCQFLYKQRKLIGPLRNIIFTWVGFAISIWSSRRGPIPCFYFEGIGLFFFPVKLHLSVDFTSPFSGEKISKRNIKWRESSCSYRENTVTTQKLFKHVVEFLGNIYFGPHSYKKSQVNSIRNMSTLVMTGHQCSIIVFYG